jgi:hypothetical protein
MQDERFMAVLYKEPETLIAWLSEEQLQLYTLKGEWRLDKICVGRKDARRALQKRIDTW